ncbi:MAG: SAVED domain-containing protein [Planctomycetota bacterium]|nr:SAVED domain-containing protein [Planctomycetota bacterium]
MTRSSRIYKKSLLKPLGREVPQRTRLFLFVCAGGRCEFDGCNRYLIEHHLTGAEGVFAQMAHIWAFSDKGPRGKSQGSTKAVHAPSNLMLLCPECHKLVDDNPDQYSANTLRKQKKSHEDRIFMLTDTKPDRHTVAVTLKAMVGGQTVSISLPQIQEAVAPRYVGTRDVVGIDLTAIQDSPRADYWSVATQAIREKTRTLYDQHFENGPARHVSVFGLAPIPLLVFLGTCLTNKVPTSLFQRHRDTEDWTWKNKGAVVNYKTRILRKGTEPTSVAIVLSLSGRVGHSDLPKAIDERFTVYEISIAGRKPTPRFLEVESSLHAFRDEFMLAMRSIVTEHNGIKKIHVFPAVPAPIAIAVGRDLMPKRDPALVVYDYDKRAGGFVQTIEVNKQ